MSIREVEFTATVRIEGVIRNIKNDGWCTCVVRLVECTNEEAVVEERRRLARFSGQQSMKTPWRAPAGIPFAGKLASHKPYMWHEGVFHFVDRGKSGRQLSPVRGMTLKPVSPSRIRLKHCIWMLCNEISTASGLVARKAVNAAIMAGKLTPMRHIKASTDERYVSFDEFERWLKSEELQNTFFYRGLFADTDFHRMKFQPMVLAVFGQGLDDVVKALRPELLEQLHKTLTTEPWKLCFYRHCGRRFEGLGELSYAGLKRALEVFRLPAVDQTIMAAVRFYQGTVMWYRNLTGDTAFPLEMLRMHHTDRSRLRDWREKKNDVIRERECTNDGPRLYSAIQYLLSEEAEALVTVKDGWVAIHWDAHCSRKVVAYLEAMAKRPSLPDLRDGDLVPCVPPILDEEQTQACLRVLRGDPIVGVTGPPGSGKTAAIEWAMSRFERVLVTAAHGMMVKELRKRLSGRTGDDQIFRPEAAYTIDYVDAVARRGDTGAQWAASFDLLVIDEASNLDLQHMYKILRATRESKHGPGIKQILFVFDHNQQRPIGVGQPVMSLMNVLPETVTHLVQQHRVHQGSLDIDRAARTMLAGMSDMVEYCTVDQGGDTLQYALETSCVINILPQAGDINTPESPTLSLIIRRLMEIGGSPTQWQFIAFRNVDVNALSLAVFRWLLAHQHLDRTKLVTVPRSQTEKYCPNGLQVCPGVKLVFLDTFRGLFDERSKRHDYPEVRNKEICVVRSVDSADGRLVTLTDGRQICLERERHVDPRKVRYGYAVTSYAAQGAGFRAVCTYVHPQPRGETTWPARDSFYTAHTRASLQSIVYGERRDIDAICGRLPRDRQTALQEMLSGINLPYRPPRLDAISIRDPDTLKLAPLTVPCGPTQKNFSSLGKEYRWPVRWLISTKRARLEEPGDENEAEEEEEDSFYALSDDDDDEEEPAIYRNPFFASEAGVDW